MLVPFYIPFYCSSILCRDAVYCVLLLFVLSSKKRWQASVKNENTYKFFFIFYKEPWVLEFSMNLMFFLKNTNLKVPSNFLICSATWNEPFLRNNSSFIFDSFISYFILGSRFLLAIIFIF